MSGDQHLLGLLSHGTACGLAAGFLAEGGPVVVWTTLIGVNVGFFVWNAIKLAQQGGDQ